ncbi:DUF721 domain-containing protein [Propionicicella superfundia]|uniref:DUF721 domain-containing protein n=1 Tax=Propionicicella superfundia TaxID=348582 RepID=UPI0004287277|nr:DciA family protein [Propionicicella superfundia]
MSNPDDEPDDVAPETLGTTAPGGVHDPTGLELARRLATGIGGKATSGRRKKAPRAPADTRADPEPLAAALDDVIRTEGWERDIAVQAVFGRWAAIVGPEVAQHSDPERLTGKVLTIRADSTAWATSLRTMAAQLVARLNAELGQGEVESVRILGPDAPDWRHGRRTVRGGRGPRDTYG